MPKQLSLSDHLKQLEEIAASLQRAPEDLEAAMVLHAQAEKHIMQAKKLLQEIEHELEVRGVELPPELRSGN